MKNNEKTTAQIRVPTMLTIAETAEFFGVPKHFVRTKINTGEVYAVKAGKKYLVNAERFADFLNGENAVEVPKSTDEKIKPIAVKLR